LAHSLCGDLFFKPETLRRALLFGQADVWRRVNILTAKFSVANIRLLLSVEFCRMSFSDEELMRLALAEAEMARSEGEVPIGAIVVFDGEIKGRGHNAVIQNSDPTAHAEIMAMRDAAKAIGNYRLTDAILYSTIEPCAMCAGTMIHARVARLVYGATDEKAGAVDSHLQICSTDFLNHRVIVEKGVLEAECRQVIQSFFRQKRDKPTQA
jgi:tRNA(Arg) A34 adenosine deaminase TadA